MAETQIEWTDATWNPVAGCSITTAGCTNCYAMEMAKASGGHGRREIRRLNAPERRPDRLDRRCERRYRAALALPHTHGRSHVDDLCQFDE